MKRLVFSALLLCLLPFSLSAQEELSIVRGYCTPNGLPEGVPTLSGTGVRRLPAINTNWDATKTYHQLVILLSFSDKDFVKEDPKAYYDKVFNEPGFNEGNGAGCVADYFREQSGGKFNLQFDIYGPYKVSSKEQPYEKPTENTHNYGRSAMREAMQMMLAENPGVDFKVYDWNGNGSVNQVVFVNAGVTGNVNSTLSYGHIWPNTDSFTTITAPDGTKISNYTISAELWPTTTLRTCGIGTICHEFSHSLGLPDAYPTGGNTGYFSVVDEWDLMDGGNFTNYGWCPPNYSTMEKMLLGWTTPVELSEAATITDLKSVADGGDTYMVRLTNNEYYLLENRQWKNWDAGTPGKGLLVWHITYDAAAWSANAINTIKGHFLYDIVHADGMDFNQWDAIITGSPYLETPRMHNKYLSGSPYPYFPIEGEPVTAFTDLPEKPVTNIKVSDDGLVSFDFMGGVPAIKGDVNGDGMVTVADITAVINVITGADMQYESTADVNNDGIVTIADITEVINNIK